MKINKITAALRGAKRGLTTAALHDGQFGKPFFGCAVGELFHAAGLNRRQIDGKTGNDDYSEIQDGLLCRVYGIKDEEIGCIHGANDNFHGDPIDRRNFMVRWTRLFNKLRNQGLEPWVAYEEARKGLLST